jgi:hypothetical protein
MLCIWFSMQTMRNTAGATFGVSSLPIGSCSARSGNRRDLRRRMPPAGSYSGRRKSILIGMTTRKTLPAGPAFWPLIGRAFCRISGAELFKNDLYIWDGIIV